MSPGAVVKHTPPQGGHDVVVVGGAVVGGVVVVGLVVAGGVVVSGRRAHTGQWKGRVVLGCVDTVEPVVLGTQSPLQGSVGVQVA